MSHPLQRENDLLCQSCGYVLSGLRRSDACPECGLPVEQSHPDQRTGTPWQQHQSIPRSVLAMLTRPGKVFDAAQIDISSSRSFKHICLFGSGLTTSLAVVVAFGMYRGMIGGALASNGLDRSLFIAVVVGAATLGVPISLFLALLTEVERRGIMLFGRVHHRRINAAVAQTIVGHAAALWFTVPVFILIGTATGVALRLLAETQPWALWEVTILAPIWAPTLGAFFGMLAFEWVVWMGVRQMKYANSSLASTTLLQSPSSTDCNPPESLH